MFKEKVQVGSIDVDGSQELKLSSLFKIMQEVASHHVDKYKIGHKELLAHNMCWVVIRMNVQILKTPKLNDYLTVTTHPGVVRGFIFPRFFQIYDEKGNLVINVSSMWCIIDKTTRRVVLKPSEFDVVKPEHNKDDMEMPEKVSGDSLSLVDTRKVRYSEIDLNGHLNNTEYIEFMLDTHKVDFYKQNRIASILINYDKEIKAGEVVELYSNNNEPEVIRGTVDGANRFTASITYERKQ